MNITIRIQTDLLKEIRKDLRRPHPYAWERVGFVAAAATSTPSSLILLVHNYQPVADDDYIVSDDVGAAIGSEAFRKAAQLAYRSKSALIHIHAHHGSGRPRFSEVDMNSGHYFVPSFFATVPRMPQGMIVLSDNSADGLIWLAEDRIPLPIHTFTQVGNGYARDWRQL